MHSAGALRKPTASSASGPRSPTPKSSRAAASEAKWLERMRKGGPPSPHKNLSRSNSRTWEAGDSDSQPPSRLRAPTAGRTPARTPCRSASPAAQVDSHTAAPRGVSPGAVSPRGTSPRSAEKPPSPRRGAQSVITDAHSVFDIGEGDATETLGVTVALWDAVMAAETDPDAEILAASPEEGSPAFPFPQEVGSMINDCAAELPEQRSTEPCTPNASDQPPAAMATVDVAQESSVLDTLQSTSAAPATQFDTPAVLDTLQSTSDAQAPQFDTPTVLDTSQSTSAAPASQFDTPGRAPATTTSAMTSSKEESTSSDPREATLAPLEPENDLPADPIAALQLSARSVSIPDLVQLREKLSAGASQESADGRLSLERDVASVLCAAVLAGGAVGGAFAELGGLLPQDDTAGCQLAPLSSEALAGARRALETPGAFVRALLKLQPSAVKSSPALGVAKQLVLSAPGCSLPSLRQWMAAAVRCADATELAGDNSENKAAIMSAARPLKAAVRSEQAEEQQPDRALEEARRVGEGFVQACAAAMAEERRVREEAEAAALAQDNEGQSEDQQPNVTPEQATTEGGQKQLLSGNELPEQVMLDTKDAPIPHAWKFALALNSPPCKSRNRLSFSPSLALPAQHDCNSGPRVVEADVTVDCGLLFAGAPSPSSALSPSPPNVALVHDVKTQLFADEAPQTEVPEGEDVRESSAAGVHSQDELAASPSATEVAASAARLACCIDARRASEASLLEECDTPCASWSAEKPPRAPVRASPSPSPVVRQAMQGSEVSLSKSQAPDSTAPVEPQQQVLSHMKQQFLLEQPLSPVSRRRLAMEEIDVLPLEHCQQMQSHSKQMELTEQQPASPMARRGLAKNEEQCDRKQPELIEQRPESPVSRCRLATDETRNDVVPREPQHHMPLHLTQQDFSEQQAALPASRCRLATQEEPKPFPAAFAAAPSPRAPSPRAPSPQAPSPRAPSPRAPSPHALRQRLPAGVAGGEGLPVPAAAGQSHRRAKCCGHTLCRRARGATNGCICRAENYLRRVRTACNASVETGEATRVFFVAIGVVCLFLTLVELAWRFGPEPEVFM